MFTYSKCKEWLKKPVERVALAGYATVMFESQKQPVSAEYRFEGKNAVGEILIWESGVTSMMLYDLHSCAFAIDRRNLELSDDGYGELAEFFEAVLRLK